MTSKVLFDVLCETTFVSMAPPPPGQHTIFTIFTVVLCTLYTSQWIYEYYGSHTRIHSARLARQLFNAKWKSNANKLLSGFCVIVNHNGANSVVAGVVVFIERGCDIISSFVGSYVYKSIKQSIWINKIGINLAIKSMRHGANARVPLTWWFGGVVLSTKESTYSNIHSFILCMFVFCLYLECVGTHAYIYFANLDFKWPNVIFKSWNSIALNSVIESSLWIECIFVIFFPFHPRLFFAFIVYQICANGWFWFYQFVFAVAAFNADADRMVAHGLIELNLYTNLLINHHFTTLYAHNLCPFLFVDYVCVRPQHANALARFGSVFCFVNFEHAIRSLAKHMFCSWFVV